MKLDKAQALAEEIKGFLAPGCECIEIAGSVCRQIAQVNDIELVCIPRIAMETDLQPSLAPEAACNTKVDYLDKEIKRQIAKGVLALRPNKRGRTSYGRQNKFLLHVATGMGIDIFSTTKECWSVSLVVRTGGKRTNIKIARAALQKGWRFHAYGSGFTDRNGELVQCRSEAEVFEFVHLPYLPPWKRR